MHVELPDDAVADAQELIQAGVGSDLAEVLSKAVAQMKAYTTPREELDEIDGAWCDEIAKRLEDVDNGRVKTIPAEEAETMIRGDAELDL